MSRRDHIWIGAAALAYGLLLWGILPDRPVAMNDDFGYLRSVVETIQHGRPWTNDFLEPWALSLSTASAGLFQITGSFYCATIGLQVAMAIVSFWFACRLAVDAGHRALAGIGVAAALITFPTLIWKQVEFTALVIQLPALFAALWFAGRRQWAWFFFAWAIALACRQTAATWLVVPLLAGAEAAIREKRGGTLKGPILLLMAGAVWIALIKGCANETHAQRFITNHIVSNATLPGVARNFGTGLWILAVTVGCASLLLRRPRNPLGKPDGNLAVRLAGMVIALGLLATLPRVAQGVPLSFEHHYFENGWAVGYLRGLVIAGALGWAFTRPAFKLSFVGAGLASLCLVCLRPELWDYYLLDAAIIAFFAVKRDEPIAEPAVSSAWVRRLQPALTGVLLAGFMGFHLAATGPLKRHVDFSYGANAVLEKALRAGWMKPAELSFAPFGYVGWHLLPYYLAHEGSASTDLGGFNGYVAGDSVNVYASAVTRHEAKAAATKFVEPAPDNKFSQICPHGWFGWSRFSLDRPGGSRPAAVAIRWDEYQFQPFPLNDAEWRALLQATTGGK